MYNKILSNAQGGVIYRNTLPIEIREDQSKNFHILAPSSHLILSSAAGSYVVVSGNLNVVSGAVTGSFSGIFSGSLSGSVDISSGKLSNIVASGTFSGSLSGSLNVNGGIVNNSLGRLIFSSTIGSIVALSASQDFVNADKPWHIRAVNSHLILSSSVGSIVSVSGSLFASGSSHSITGTLSLLDGISASYYDARNTTSNYHFRAVNSHLIFSSSSGSKVTVSGTLNIFNDVGQDGLIITGSAASRKGIIIYPPVGQQASILLGDGATDIWQLGKQTDKTFFIYNSVSAANVLVLSGTGVGVGGTPDSSAKLDIQGTNGALLLPRLTTAQRDALVAVAGMLIYNSSTSTFQGFSSSWGNLQGNS